MLTEGRVFRHGKSTISRRDDGVFFLQRKAGAPYLKRGFFACFPRLFQPFILFGGIDFRLFLRRDIALRPAVIPRSCQKLKTQLTDGYRLTIFVAHGSMLQFPLGIGQPLRKFFRSDADLKKPYENLPDLAGAESRPGQIGPMKSNVFFAQRFQTVNGCFRIRFSRKDRKIFLSVFSVRKDDAGFLQEGASGFMDASMPDSVKTGA